jgi:hypothetical protein
MARDRLAHERPVELRGEGPHAGVLAEHLDRFSALWRSNASPSAAEASLIAVMVSASPARTWGTPTARQRTKKSRTIFARYAPLLLGIRQW